MVPSGSLESKDKVVDSVSLPERLQLLVRGAKLEDQHVILMLMDLVMLGLSILKISYSNIMVKNGKNKLEEQAILVSHQMAKSGSLEPKKKEVVEIASTE